MSELILKGMDGANVAVSEKAIKSLTSSLHGSIITSEDPSYAKERSLWNGMIDKRPGLIAKCRGPADVKACVKFAAERGVLLAVRGGGHNVAGNALCDGGMVIDLSEMRSVSCDPSNQVVHIQGGATLGDVDSETFRHGLATPAGVVSATGYAGLALHGGMGWQTRKHGLATDNIHSVDIVTADGELIKADKKRDADLFWAVRGGGGNFGVVTSFTSLLHPIPPELLFVVTLFKLEHAADVIRFVREFSAEAPDEVSLIAIFWTVPEIEDIPREYHNDHALFLVGCFIGDPVDGERVFKPLRNCRPVIADLSATQSWKDIQQFFDADYPDGRRYYWKSTMVKTLSDEMVEKLVKQASERPSLLTSIDIWTMGGAFGRVDSSATAFGARDVSFTINYESNWEDAASDGINVQWTRSALKEIQEMSQVRTYLNFAGLAEEADQMLKDSFGEGYRRLQSIKEIYDPENLFRTNFNIRPKG